MKEVSERTDGAVVIGPGSLHFTLSKLLEDILEGARGKKLMPRPGTV